MSVGTRNYLFDNQGYLSPDKKSSDDSMGKFYHSMTTSPEKSRDFYTKPIVRGHKMSERDELKFRIQRLCREYNAKYSENVFLEFASSSTGPTFPEFELVESPPRASPKRTYESFERTPIKESRASTDDSTQEVNLFQKSSSKIRDSIQSARHLISSLKGKGELEVSDQGDSNPEFQKVRENAAALQSSIEKLENANSDFCEILKILQKTISCLNQNV
jgi:Mg2+ and Co2+ transporter CorA